jgi:hypothetical protein
MVDKDGPDFYFLFLNGSQGSPNLSFASIDWDWDCPIPPLWRRDDKYWDCPNFNFVEMGEYWG